MSWRVNWALRQFVDLSGYRKHARVLRHSSQFYRGLLFKLVPGVISKPLNLALRDGYTIQIHEFMTLFIYKEIFVDCCYDLALGRHEPVIVDIGANTGLFALRMKQLYPGSRITCYEPFPPNFAKLKRLIELNHLESVVPVLKAVGARDGNVRLYIHRRNVGGHSLYASEASNDEYVNVEIVDVRSVLDGLPGSVDLVKADCEGAEFEILMALTRDHAEKIRQIIIEPTPKLYDIQKLLAHMRLVGYSQHSQQGLFVFSRA